MSVGVGRGRGRLPQQVNGDIEPLRRPNVGAVGRGRASQPNALSRSKTVDIELAVSDPKIESLVLFKVFDDFLSSNPSDDDIQDLLKKIFDKVLKGKTNVDCICKCLYLASKHKIKGDNLYENFFMLLEQKFTGLESIKEKSGPSGLWRFQLLFSSVCHYVRNVRAPPLEDLVDGLKKLCLEAVQPANSEQASIAAISVSRCVSYMKMASSPPSQVDALVSKLRGLLHASSTVACTDPNILLWFSLGLESCCYLPSKITDETLQYYCRILGPEASMFNLTQLPALNLPKQAQANYNFSDISYILNFT